MVLLAIIGLMILGYLVLDELEKVHEVPATEDLCGSCGARVEKAWLLCPHCSCRLKISCCFCHRLIRKALSFCPHCGSREEGRNP